MLTTEKEAQKKACLQMEIHATPAEIAGCMASSCMAWRWWIGDGKEKGEARRGYCGSGGQPTSEE